MRSCGRARQVTRSLTTQASQHGLAESQRAGVQACVRYLTGKNEYLRYDEALTAGGRSPPASPKEPACCGHAPACRARQAEPSRPWAAAYPVTGVRP